MPNIRDQKLLYHLTRLDNLPSILRQGLAPRAQVQEFADVADPEIIENRRDHGLENFVPFHWFAGNPFDGRVQIDHRSSAFVLITVRRALAAQENWTVIPRHPLTNRHPELLSYSDGFRKIDWETMNRREYRDSQCKSVCMAECLSPRTLHPAEFFKIYSPNEQVAVQARQLIRGANLIIEVDVNRGMFC
jgi:hypothetical protein